ncbi:MAG: hypothetical protein RL497_2913 [Pseudomonadota bacterium]|jgi:mannobiose 2-epimerase
MPEALLAEAELQAQLPVWQAELQQLGNWWSDIARDPAGGFYGEVGLDNRPVPDAPRGLIQQARILYFFSQLARHTGEPKFAQAAEHAYRYLHTHFADVRYGGYFWSVAANGEKLDGRKHLYAQAFMIYGLVAYHQLTRAVEPLNAALHLFTLIECYGLEPEFGGYLEAFSEHWGPLDDIRLSEKEPLAPKTMNTHLHILEAYSALAEVCAEPAVTSALKRLVGWFCQHIINRQSGHVRMFMDMQWRDLSRVISFGHDIETSWLLHKALQACGDETLLHSHQNLVLRLAEVSLAEAGSPTGGVRDEQELHSGTYHEDRTWWAQSEALVGYLYAWKLSGDERYAQRAQAIWQFIWDHHRDAIGGEWFWFSTLDVAAADRNYKSGFWKCPYHNGRALIEACRILCA